MSTETNAAVAVRNGNTPATPAGALAIHAGQTTWDEYQGAALNQLGLKEAGNGDRAVFLHVCQRTGLDPFARQIYMIGRPELGDDNKWGKKWTIQTGIKGWRVIRDRAERREGVRGTLSRFTYYDGDDNEKKVWTRPEPPAVIEVTYTVIDRNAHETPYTIGLRFSEYVQRKKDGSVNKMWSEKAVHMLEKCTEAAVYALAFPEDFSGVQLDDAMPPAADWDSMSDEELDQRARAVGYRPRVTAGQARARSPRTVTAEVVTPEPSPAAAGDPPPPAEPPRPADAPQGQAAGESPATPAQVKAIWTCLRTDYGYGKEEEGTARAAVAAIAGGGLARLESLNGLTAAEASRVLGQLREWVRDAKETGERPRDILAADIASRDAGPREDGEPGE
jgi:phage recombination protein Bet